MRKSDNKMNEEQEDLKKLSQEDLIKIIIQTRKEKEGKQNNPLDFFFFF